MNGFQGFKIEQDRRSNYSNVIDFHQIPFIKSTSLPPPYIGGIGGGIAYDTITRRPYYSDGLGWFPIGTGVISGATNSYSFIKDGDQSISTGTVTTLIGWEIASSSVYHTIPGWNLTTGIYTSSVNEKFTLYVNISWEAGVSNLGDRILRVEVDTGAGFLVVKEVVTQADAKTAVETTQELQIHLSLDATDRVRVIVEHNAPISIVVAGGNHTSVSGFQIPD